MKKFFRNTKNAITKKAIKTKLALENTKAEGYIDTGVKIIIGVVIGGVILASLYALFNNVILPNLSTEVTEMFDYSGS